MGEDDLTEEKNWKGIKMKFLAICDVLFDLELFIRPLT
jgi:hypothetical protein